MPDAVNRAGKPGVIIHGIAMRPAMPTALAVVDGVPVVILSGNPVAAMIGFEVFGRKETLVVYANSKTEAAEMHFKLTLAGTKNKDYYLLALDVGDSAFAKTGVYREYPESIVIEGV